MFNTGLFYLSGIIFGCYFFTFVGFAAYLIVLKFNFNYFYICNKYIKQKLYNSCVIKIIKNIMRLVFFWDFLYIWLLIGWFFMMILAILGGFLLGDKFGNSSYGVILGLIVAIVLWKYLWLSSSFPINLYMYQKYI